MNLYLKQKVFSWGDKFTVYDGNGEPVFYVKGEVFSFGKKLHLYDVSGEELRFIYQKLFSFRPKYYINKNGIDIAEVVKQITFFHQSYYVSGFNWNVEGDFFAHSYEILSPTGRVARISKHWFTWGDTYEISTENGYDDIDVLAVVLVIDACLAAANTADASEI